METGTIISLAAYFLLMLGIGLYAYRASSEDSSGYLLGGRQLGPGVTALSAGASDMSGWMVMGLPCRMRSTVAPLPLASREIVLGARFVALARRSHK